MVETYFYSWAIIWFLLVTFHVKDYSWKWWSVLWMSVETGKKTSFNHQKPRMKKRLCFSRLLRLLCKLRVSDPDRPLACKDEEEWVFVVALYLFVRILFYVILKKSDLQRLCRNNRPQTSVEMSFITTICFGVQKLLVD